MQAILHKLAKKYLNKQTADKQEQIRAAIKDLEKEPPKGDIRPYAGNPGILRLVVGNHRLLFKYEDNYILVSHIEPRGQAYTKKTRNKRG